MSAPLYVGYFTCRVLKENGIKTIIFETADDQLSQEIVLINTLYAFPNGRKVRIEFYNDDGMEPFVS
jgi:hypothetical protein